MTEAQWRTHRLELDDQTLREWDAVVLDAGPDGIVLDRSAFYPGGGGQCAAVGWRADPDSRRTQRR
jgi:misacylated tRNA(Ala) deacylase